LIREIERYREQVPDKGKWSLLLPLLPADGDGWRGQGIDGRGNPVHFDYDSMVGLRRAEDTR
jgi:CRISPR-associated endonuclease/helicase Cas3